MVEINSGSNTVVVISVYLPYQSPGIEVEYLEKLGYINAVTNDLALLLLGTGMLTLEMGVNLRLLDTCPNCVWITAAFFPLRHCFLQIVIHLSVKLGAAFLA